MTNSSSSAAARVVSLRRGRFGRLPSQHHDNERGRRSCEVRTRRRSRALASSKRPAEALSKDVQGAQVEGAESPSTSKVSKRWLSPLRWILALAELLDSGPNLGPAPNELPEEDREGLAFQGRCESELMFSGGCFWCLQRALDSSDAIEETTVGYTGGILNQPTYGQVQSRKSGHVECVLVKVRGGAYADLNTVMKLYLDSIDPTDDVGQGNNVGPQYRSCVFYHTDPQLKAAKEALAAESERRGGRTLAVRVRKATRFWKAEEVHQDYYEKNGIDPEPDVPYWMNAFLD